MSLWKNIYEISPSSIQKWSLQNERTQAHFLGKTLPGIKWWFMRGTCPPILCRKFQGGWDTPIFGNTHLVPWTIQIQAPTKLIRLDFQVLEEYPSTETNIFAPENQWLEDEFPFGMAHLQVRTVSFTEGTPLPLKITVLWCNMPIKDGSIFQQNKQNHLKQTL